MAIEHKIKHMRYILTIIILTIFFNSNSQSLDSIKPTIKSELKTITIINNFVENYAISGFDTFDSLTKNLITTRGAIENIQRLIIIHKILKGKPSEKSINDYFTSDYHYKFISRIEDSRKIDFGYQYSSYKSYYDYIPLRHSIDSITIKEAQKLLKTDNITIDERIVCTLFSGDIKTYDKIIKKTSSKKSNLVKQLDSRRRKSRNRWIGFTIYSGAFKPIGSKKVFGTSPFWGFTISSPIAYKLIVELGIKYRLNLWDNHFDFYALDKTNNADSNSSAFLGVLIGYKIYESKNIIVLPKFGIGAETVDTGISDNENNDNSNRSYYNVETIHFSLGLTVMTPIFKTSHLGFGINYHYCPYSLEKDLYTTFNENLLSAEVFWRF